MGELLSGWWHMHSANLLFLHSSDIDFATRIICSLHPSLSLSKTVIESYVSYFGQAFATECGQPHMPLPCYARNWLCLNGICFVLISLVAPCVHWYSTRNSPIYSSLAVSLNEDDVKTSRIACNE